VLLRLSIATGVTQVVTYGTLGFAVLFLMREKGMTLREIAVYYALLIAVTVTSGMYISGRLIDRLVPRTRVAYAAVPGIALLFAIPFFVGFLWAPDWPLALACLAFPFFLNYFYLSPAVALVQEQVAPNERVLSGALLLLVMNLMGLGLGPTIVGKLSEWLRPAHPEHSLQLSFHILVPFYLLAVLCFLWLARALRREEKRGATR